MTSHATTVLIEAPSPERAKGYPIGAPKSSFRGPKAVKSGWYPDLAVKLFGVCLPSLFRTETPLPKATKGWKSPQQLRAVYSIFYFAKNPLIPGFIHREHGYPIRFHHHQPSTYLHSSSYANEQSLSSQQSTQSCHSGAPQRLQLYFTTAVGWLKLSLQRLSNTINVLQHHCDIHGRKYVQHVGHREHNLRRRLVPVVPII
jgi:hypothetical protein